jgi:hypothetical protein
VLIGSPGYSAAYLFNMRGRLITTFTNPVPTAAGSHAFFGYPVQAVGRDKVLIGAHSVDVLSADAHSAGEAYLFNLQGKLLNTFTNPVPEDSDFFSYSLATLGSHLVVIGAWENNYSGSLRVYSTAGKLLTTLTNPIPPDLTAASRDVFGYAVTTAGRDRLFAGTLGLAQAPWSDGAAYSYALGLSIENASIDNLVPCSGPYPNVLWRNHTQYVNATAKAARDLRKQGWITQAESKAIVQQAMRSACGKSSR